MKMKNPLVIRTTISPTHSSVLESSPSDTDDEIRRKYNRLVMQYHPDHVTNLGIEIRQLAERKTVQINRAYALIRLQRGINPNQAANDV